MSEPAGGGLLDIPALHPDVPPPLMSPVNISTSNNLDIVTIESAHQVSYLNPGLINGTQGKSTYLFFNLTRASLDDPFHPSDQDKTHFDVWVFCFNRPKHSASAWQGAG